MVVVRGTERRIATIEVDKHEIWEIVKEKIMRSMPGEYINTKGEWEIDYGGHGSGYREQVRPATEHELEIMVALELVKVKYLEKPHK